MVVLSCVLKWANVYVQVVFSSAVIMVIGCFCDGVDDGLKPSLCLMQNCVDHKL